MFDLAIMPLKRRGVAIASTDNMGRDRTRGARGSTLKVDKPDAVIELRRLDHGIRLATTHQRGGNFLGTLDLDAEGFDRSVSIRYWRSAGGWPPGTKAAVAVLDRLGAPFDDGRRKARSRLADEIAAAEAAQLDPADYRIGNEALAAAVRFRKARMFDPMLSLP